MEFQKNTVSEQDIIKEKQLLNLTEKKQEIIKSIKDGFMELNNFNETIRGDRDIVIEAINKDSWNLRYASPELRNDREIVLEAMKSNGIILQCAGEKLRKDRELVLLAVQEENNPLIISSELIPLKFRDDREIVLHAVKNCPFNIQYASPELQNDKEIVLEAVKRDGYMLQNASKELQNDKEVVLLAIKNDGHAFRFTSPELKEKYGDTKEEFITNIKKEEKEQQIEYLFQSLRGIVSYTEEEKQELYKSIKKRIMEEE